MAMRTLAERLQAVLSTIVATMDDLLDASTIDYVPDRMEFDLASPTGKLILVMGARGGVGATTMAVRIASGLAEHPPRPVLLVDLDLQFGDAVLQLDATPSHALREALEKGEIELRYEAGEGSFSAWYFDHRLPIAPD